MLLMIVINSKNPDRNIPTLVPAVYLLCKYKFQSFGPLNTRTDSLDLCSQMCSPNAERQFPSSCVNRRTCQTDRKGAGEIKRQWCIKRGLVPLRIRRESGWSGKWSGNGVDGAQMVVCVGQTWAQTVGLTYDRGILDGSLDALASLMRKCKYN